MDRYNHLNHFHYCSLFRRECHQQWQIIHPSVRLVISLRCHHHHWHRRHQLQDQGSWKMWLTASSSGGECVNSGRQLTGSRQNEADGRNTKLGSGKVLSGWLLVAVEMIAHRWPLGGLLATPPLLHRGGIASTTPAPSSLRLLEQFFSLHQIRSLPAELTASRNCNVLSKTPTLTDRMDLPRTANGL